MHLMNHLLEAFLTMSNNVLTCVSIKWHGNPQKTTPLFQFEIMYHICPHTHTHSPPIKRHNILLSFKPSIHQQMEAVPFFSSMCEYNSCAAYILFKTAITKCNHNTKWRQNRHLPFNKTKNQVTSPITHMLLTCVHYLPKYKTRILLHQRLESEGVGLWSRIQLCILYRGIFLKIQNLIEAILHSGKYHMHFYICLYTHSNMDVKLNSVALVRTRTIPTERPPPVGEVSANFCG